MKIEYSKDADAITLTDENCLADNNLELSMASPELRNYAELRRSSLMLRVFLIIMFTAILMIAPMAQAKEIPFTQEDRDRLIRLEVTLKEFKESVDKRFEQIDKRFEQVDKRFEQIMTFMWMLAGIFTAITASTIGFAIWDRRSMTRPFETRVKELEEGKIDKVISSLRTLAKTDAKLAEVLRQYNLL